MLRRAVFKINKQVFVWLRQRRSEENAPQPFVRDGCTVYLLEEENKINTHTLAKWNAQKRC